MACRKVLVQAQRRDVTLPHLKLYFLIHHVSQDRDKANSAAVIKVMRFFLAFIARHQVSSGRKINRHLRSHRVTVWWAESMWDVL